MILRDFDRSIGEQEGNWKIDLRKCFISDEAAAQRTIMMEAINRHAIEKDPDYASLDYACKSQWNCCSMPHTIRSVMAQRLAKPRPDLAFAFRTHSVMDRRHLLRLENWTGYMCPEAIKEDKIPRAFHFFAMEPKGAQHTPGDYVGFRQNLNMANLCTTSIRSWKRLARSKNFSRK